MALVCLINGKLIHFDEPRRTECLHEQEPLCFCVAKQGNQNNPTSCRRSSVSMRALKIDIDCLKQQQQRGGRKNKLKLETRNFVPLELIYNKLAPKLPAAGILLPWEERRCAFSRSKTKTGLSLCLVWSGWAILLPLDSCKLIVVLSLGQWQLNLANQVVHDVRLSVLAPDRETLERGRQLVNSNALNLLVDPEHPTVCIFSSWPFNVMIICS